MASNSLEKVLIKLLAAAAKDGTPYPGCAGFKNIYRGETLSH